MFYYSEAQQLDPLRGMALREAFEHWVLNDPTVLKAADAAVATGRVKQLAFKWVSTLFRKGHWPLRIKNPDGLAAIKNGDVIPQRRGLRGERVGTRKKGPPEYRKLLCEIFIAYNSLIDLLRGGYLVTFGFRSGVADTTSIPLQEWWDRPFKIDLTTGDMLAAVGESWAARYSSITIERTSFPATRYDGLTLSEAFRELVLCDPGVVMLAPKVEAASQISASYVLNGMFWGMPKDSFWWPIFLRHRFGQMPDGQWSYEGQFRSALADRMTLFLEPLTSGEVEANGQNRLVQSVAIPRSIWKDESEEIHIHARSSSIGEWKLDGILLSKDGPITRYSEIELQANPGTAEASSDLVTTSAESLNHPLPTTGISKTNPKAVGRMKQLFQSDRMAKATMRELIHSEFPDMSKREFDRQWSINAPDAWRRAGRHKSSQ